jgi:hypothetical protein
MAGNSGSSRWHVLRIGEREVRYYLVQPSPERWSAVGVLYARVDGSVPRACRMLVGNGQTEHDAVADLVTRARRSMIATGNTIGSATEEAARAVASARRPVTAARHRTRRPDATVRNHLDDATSVASVL